jgi:hypothetical protein
LTQAWAQAYAQAMDQALDQALDQANACIPGSGKEQWRKYFRDRADIWRAGYGVVCDIEGVFYVYKHL